MYKSPLKDKLEKKYEIHFLQPKTKNHTVSSDIEMFIHLITLFNHLTLPLGFNNVIKSLRTNLGTELL